MKWKAPYFPIRKMTKEEQKDFLEIKLKDWGKCSFCQEPKIDNCYNCGTPICRKHVVGFVFFMHICFGICPECVKDNNLEEKFPS